MDQLQITWGLLQIKIKAANTIRKVANKPMKVSKKNVVVANKVVSLQLFLLTCKKIGESRKYLFRKYK